MSLSAAVIAALIAAGVGAGTWNAIGSNTHGKDYRQISRHSNKKFNEYLEGNADYKAMWEALPSDLQNALVSNYSYVDNNVANLWGLFGGDREVLDYERMLEELSNSGDMLSDYAELGERPTLDSYLSSAYGEVQRQNEVEFDALDKLLAEQEALYNEDMSNISQGYNDMRTNLLSQQYQQNLQTMDTLQSDMSRTRQNALEAGASAGIRIAGNVNALLSAQNKQSATSMDTANQLAQMMINQRNEESAARREYQNYRQSDTAARRDLRLSTDSRAYDYANNRYNAAAQSYDSKRTDLDNAWQNSGLYDYRHGLSKFSSGGTTR